MREVAGKVRVVKVGVRSKGKEEWRDLPWGFVERFPDLAVTYKWVREEDKARARRLLSGVENGTSKLPSLFSS